ncbi:MAG: hypothetical protein AAFV62_03960, partial [Pseudomonadota bacterium]
MGSPLSSALSTVLGAQRGRDASAVIRKFSELQKLTRDIARLDCPESGTVVLTTRRKRAMTGAAPEFTTALTFPSGDTVRYRKSTLVHKRHNLDLAIDGRDVLRLTVDEKAPESPALHRLWQRVGPQLSAVMPELAVEAENARRIQLNATARKAMRLVE